MRHGDLTISETDPHFNTPKEREKWNGKKHFGSVQQG